MLIYVVATGERMMLLYYKNGIAVCRDKEGINHFILSDIAPVQSH